MLPSSFLPWNTCMLKTSFSKSNFLYYPVSNLKISWSEKMATWNSQILDFLQNLMLQLTKLKIRLFVELSNTLRQKLSKEMRVENHSTGGLLDAACMRSFIRFHPFTLMTKINWRKTSVPKTQSFWERPVLPWKTSSESSWQRIPPKGLNSWKT